MISKIFTRQPKELYGKEIAFFVGKVVLQSRLERNFLENGNLIC